jgi:hypothetical protein
MNEPAACYVPVIPGSRWYYATYNTDRVQFFYFPEGKGDFNFTTTLSCREGHIVIDHDSLCAVEVPIAVMMEFVRQAR